MKALMTKGLMALVLSLMAVGAQAHTFATRMSHSAPGYMKIELSNNGKSFHSGDHLSFNLDGLKVTNVKLNASGYRDATVTLLADGRNYGTYRYYNRQFDPKAWEVSHYKWNATPIYRLSLQFGDIDPQVYSVEIWYEPDTVVRTEIQVVEKRVEVAKKQVNEVAERLATNFNTLNKKYQGGKASRTFLNRMQDLLWNLDAIAGKSRDSDASQYTAQYIQRVLLTGNCLKGREIIMSIGRRAGDQYTMRKILEDLWLLAEMHDFFPDERTCSQFTTNWPNSRKIHPTQMKPQAYDHSRDSLNPEDPYYGSDEMPGEEDGE